MSNAIATHLAPRLPVPDVPTRRERAHDLRERAWDWMLSQTIHRIPVVRRSTMDRREKNAFDLGVDFGRGSEPHYRTPPTKESRRNLRRRKRNGLEVGPVVIMTRRQRERVADTAARRLRIV